MDVQHLIAGRKNGKGNTQDELRFLAQGAASNSIPDYQLSAWLMAECFMPLNLQETAWLTVAMAESGERIDLSGIPKPWIDKHSTGGVGDKTTLVLLPLLASCGLSIVKMSGRGLGITGGTVDKLESIPGFRMDLSPDELVAQALAIGIAITGQSPSLAPADKTMYALRDVTATVDSIPLIVSSILSKKLAGGADMVVLDVKCGAGGFMRDLESARALARVLKETGELIGLPVHIAITEMSQPLGTMVGNLLEVKEAAAVLKGQRGRFTTLCLDLAAHTLRVAGRATSEAEALGVVGSALKEGRALGKAKAWFANQGATVDVFEHPERLPESPIRREVKLESGGWIAKVDAGFVGEAVLHLGGGRHNTTDEIDPTVGVECLKHVGDTMAPGEGAFIIHAASQEAAAKAEQLLLSAIDISPTEVAEPPLILDIL